MIFQYVSADGQEGYPGEVIVQVICYVISHPSIDAVGFLTKYKATSTKPTIINLTNHAYFNLAGHGTGAAGLYEQNVCVKGKYITETDSNSIPTGKFLNVQNTPYDLTETKKIGDVINTVPNGGYDNNYCLTDEYVNWSGTVPKPKPNNEKKYVAR